jgi:acyl phosphate:glycerol-3-phosphate acyltransferase
MDGSTLVLALAFAVIGYLCGSVPVGVLVARAMGGPDPRTVGSGRTGTTNALRALGRRGAAFVVLGDLLKGFVPVWLASVASGSNSLVESAAGLGAVVGACRSMFLGLSGGRGVVTLAGTMLVIEPTALLIAGPILILTLVASGYMSLGSLLGSAALVPSVIAIGVLSTGVIDVMDLGYAAIGAATVWIAHADNIDRLAHGTERKFDFAMLRGGRAEEG